MKKREKDGERRKTRKEEERERQHSANADFNSRFLLAVCPFPVFF